MPETGNNKIFILNTGKEFDKNKTNHYELSIQVSLDGFSFFVFSDEHKKVLAGKNTLVKISSPKLVSNHFYDWFNTEPLLKLPYQKVNIFIFEECFTLIPDTKNPELFNRFSAELLTNPEGDRYQFQNQINGFGAMLHFGVLGNLVNTVNSLFSAVEWTHPVSVLLNSFPASEKSNTGILLQSQHFFFLLLKRKNQLLLANCFRAEHASDLVYYLLNTFSQLGISRNITQMFVAEKTNNMQHIGKLLAPYFPAVSDLNTNLNYEDPAAEINRLHLYLTLNKF